MAVVKTSDLTGIALDWAVAKCEGIEAIHYGRGLWYGDSGQYEWHPTEFWAQGGPIIERGKIELFFQPELKQWVGRYDNALRFGDTPLIAAMRCYVAVKLGDEIEIPEELV